jgi:glucokinase
MIGGTNKKSNQNGRLVFAADLGGTHLRAATIDELGRVHFHIKQKTPAAESADQIVGELVRAARDGEKQGAREGRSIHAICVAVPGSVDISAGRVVKAPNLPCLDGFDLAAKLTKELKRKSILENDANAAAVGEMWRGAARNCRTIICVTLGTGVGGGIVLEGELWHGVNDSAAEIGHMCVEPFAGVVCSCGSRGCLEVYTSGTAIVRMTREARPRHPESMLEGERLTAKKIYCAAVKGDQLALEVFRRMGAYLGIGLANLINVLNPEMIVIAGGVVNAWELFAKDMNQQIAERAFPLPAGQMKVVRGECGDDAGLLGAAKLALAI